MKRITSQQARELILAGEATDGLIVDGSLFLTGCTSLTTLPEDLQVGRNLYLTGCTSLTALPEDLVVGGNLYLCGCTSLATLLDDERDYRLVRLGDRYYAGCRNFNASEALEHWGSKDYPDPERGALFAEAVKAEERRLEES